MPVADSPRNRGVGGLLAHDALVTGTQAGLAHMGWFRFPTWANGHHVHRQTNHGLLHRHRLSVGLSPDHGLDCHSVAVKQMSQRERGLLTALPKAVQTCPGPRRVAYKTRARGRFDLY